MESRLLVASNRGPLSFTLDDQGEPVPGQPAGGLAGTLLPLLEGSEICWVSSTMNEADRKAAAAGVTADGDIRVAVVEPDPATYRLAYDVVANATLWFVHHHLFDAVHRPRLDFRFREAWEGYRVFNEAFTSVVSAHAAHGASVLVQDYHLALLPGMLRSVRPDLHVAHFTHTPFADPNVLRMLPSSAGRELLAGMAGAHACGFHTARWEAAFVACCADHDVPAPRTFVSPLAPDTEGLRLRMSSPAVEQAAAQLAQTVGDCQVVLRVDRIEPAKNHLRSFWAFDELLRRHPEWRGRVVLLSLGYPSRQELAEYLSYAAEVELAAARVNETWGDERWTPIVLDVVDDADRSLAALLRYDVLLVNSLRDGLNLVAMEGPVANIVDGVLALSREAGAFEQLRGPALELNPFDVAETAEVLHRALAMQSDERRERGTSLRALASARSPKAWLAEQLSAIAE